jgi:chromosomal replication initiation ATPase DnaA
VIPARFCDVSIDTYEPRSLSQRSAKLAVVAWLEAVAAGKGPMLALVGSQGTGKSHLLYAAARSISANIDAMDPKARAMSKATHPFVAPWYSLADQLRYGLAIQTEAGSRHREAHEVRGQLWGRAVVLLDEVRPTSATGFDDSELAKFACHAYDNRVAVLVTTNVNPLEQVMGPAAASRFREVVVEGPDARQAA